MITYNSHKNDVVNKLSLLILNNFVIFDHISYQQVILNVILDFLIICGMFECINVCQSTTCLKMISEDIESYGKLALVVNQRHPPQAIC